MFFLYEQFFFRMKIFVWSPCRSEFAQIWFYSNGLYARITPSNICFD